MLADGTRPLKRPLDQRISRIRGLTKLSIVPSPIPAAPHVTIANFPLGFPDNLIPLVLLQRCPTVGRPRLAELWAIAHVGFNIAIHAEPDSLPAQLNSGAKAHSALLGIGYGDTVDFAHPAGCHH